MYQSNKHATGNRGFAMAEALLAVIVISFIFFGLSKLQAQSNSELKARQVAENLNKVTEIFSQYLVANRGDDTTPKLIKAMTDGTNAGAWCVINANTSTGVGTTANNTTLHTCAVDISFLKYKKLVPQGFSEVNAFGQRWTAIYRLVYEDFDNNAATAITSDGSVEMLIVPATNSGIERPMDTSSAVLASTISGFTGGYIPSGTWGNCKYIIGTKEACGSSGSWKIDLSKFLNTP